MADPIDATFTTSMGDIVVRLLPEKAPKTVENFLGLAEGTGSGPNPSRAEGEGPLYDGTIFHRVIPDFMIQGGDPLGTGTGGPGYKFADEIQPRQPLRQAVPARHGERRARHQRLPVLHHRGADALARRRHTIFGEVVKGGELIPKITRAGNNKVKLEKVSIARG